MIPAELPPELRTACWCPDCAKQLRAAPTVDPWALCLACPAEHQFFVDPEPQGRPSTAADASFAELEHADAEAIARFWLAEPRARALLNNQLAQILRALLEKRAPEQTPKARFCPICAGALNEGKTSARGQVGLLCSAKHEWLVLIRSLSNVTGLQQAFVLHPENSRQATINLVHGWLEEEKLGAYVHDSVRGVLAASELARAAVLRPSP